VAGIGNIFFGDDAFGSEVARRLLCEKWPESVRVGDFGIRSIDLMYALLDGYDTVVLIDATPRGGAPGTLYLIEPEIDRIGAEGLTLETHSMDVCNVLAAAKSMGAQWRHLFLIGCEPSPNSAGPEDVIEMSAAVMGAMENAIEMVRDIVCKSTLAKSPK